MKKERKKEKLYLAFHLMVIKFSLSNVRFECYYFSISCTFHSYNDRKNNPIE